MVRRSIPGPNGRVSQGACEEDLEVVISVDLTSIRATQGADSNYKDLTAEPADHALGRSRGGWTTRIRALAGHWCSPTTLLLSAGQAGDNPQLAPLLQA